MTRDEIVKQLRDQVFALTFDGFYNGDQYHAAVVTTAAPRIPPSMPWD